MGNTDPILTALAGMEERILQAVGDQLRDFRLEVNGRFDSLEHRMARLEQEYERLNVAVARVEADVATLKADVTTLKVDVTTLKATVHRVESRMDREDADPRRLQEDEAVFRRRLDELEARLRVLEEHLPRD
jgi:chromosome segregation ATPase